MAYLSCLNSVKSLKSLLYCAKQYQAALHGEEAEAAADLLIFRVRQIGVCRRDIVHDLVKYIPIINIRFDTNFDDDILSVNWHESNLEDDDLKEEILRFNFKLKPQFGTLSMDIRPEEGFHFGSDPVLTLNGVKVDNSPRELYTFDDDRNIQTYTVYQGNVIPVYPGRVTINVSADNFESQKIDMLIREGENISVPVVLKAETGIAFSNYVSKTKAEEAANLLTFSEYTDSEISNLLGFSSQSYFIKIFKKYLGVTPKEYKKRYKFPDFSKENH